MTTVRNLATGDEIDYSCDAKTAVVAAHEQFYKKNWNTWTYDLTQAVVSGSGKFVYCGIFAASMEQKEGN